VHSANHIFISYSYEAAISIASLAARLRHDLQLSIEEEFPIVDVLEFQIVQFCKDFRLVVDSSVNFDQNVLAMARLAPPEIAVRESVYQHAAVGSEPARVILAHELGHLLLAHGAASSAEHIQLEWEADEFAAELLMPSAIASTMSEDRIARQFAVPLRTAKSRLEKLKPRQKYSSKKGVPRFECYTPLVSQFEKELLYWVPPSVKQCSKG
jgi:hypothetical protein